ncbi:RNA polymerase sigma factor [Flavihumibacter petaseus]|uniref:Putative RNA polymerase ECF-type sigma factor n=1 Tax=Flavihumibacter petaseus NBRC 106054 TaxID=1220578 RepID=A0A0E9N3E7_9BACT|nr:sigma-70 family RNA polymerase sigma factor [Flavihumibacter petaseus]GAO44201.1 putative RNA polymerase ECF-type sigma factor [Flavihumibacter petaseus NBRC 106054]
MSANTDTQTTASYQQHWQAFRMHNEQSLYWLYHAEYDRFYRFGLLSSPDAHLVKSAINTVFIDLWGRRTTLPEVENVRGYLFICFKRQLFHAIRREKDLTVELPANPPVILTESSYEDALIGHELDNIRREQIRKALDNLTERQRMFIRMRFFEELEYEDIAEQSNTSVRTVYNTIHNAISRLREELGDVPFVLAWLTILKKF